MNRKTFYYRVNHDGAIGEKFENQDELQVAIAMSGTPHHAACIMCVTFEGLIPSQKPVKTQFLPVWYSHWRDLELAKQRLNEREKTDAR